jgi:hypothetical protein
MHSYSINRMAPLVKVEKINVYDHCAAVYAQSSWLCIAVACCQTNNPGVKFQAVAHSMGV